MHCYLSELECDAVQHTKSLISHLSTLFSGMNKTRKKNLGENDDDIRLLTKPAISLRPRIKIQLLPIIKFKEQLCWRFSWVAI